MSGIKGRPQTEMHRLYRSQSMKRFYELHPEKKPNPMSDPSIKQKALLAIQSPTNREKLSRIMTRIMNSPEVQFKISGPNHHNWQGGLTYKQYPREWNKELREMIRDRDDHLCQMPGCYIFENGRKHPVHHIDYTKHHNDPVNLLTLCLSCHSRTSMGNREYWTEMFQELQRIRGL